MTEGSAIAPPTADGPDGRLWPTLAWTRGEAGAEERKRLQARSDFAFGPEGVARLGETLALLIVQGGRIIHDRYAEGRSAGSTFPSWSMAKSITHALVGLLVKDGRLDVRAPAHAPEWSAEGDPRAKITLDHLLRMSSGLAFREIYREGEGSDVIEMLFGQGAPDMAAFAAGFPLEHEPGRFFSYSSGTTNIICRALRQALGADGPGFEAFMRRRLFDPLGMRTASPKFDASGTFVGSSFCYASAEDFARFGLLYLRDGVWAGERLLPEGWVEYARTPTFRQADCPDGPYGAHWWLETAGPGSFSANGFEGQFIVLEPDLDLILVRLGRTPAEAMPALAAFVGDLVQDLRP